MRSIKRTGCYGVVAACAAVAPLVCSGATIDTSDDRIAISLNGSTLPGTNGGGGGSVGWLHNFDADTLAGVAVEHQGISNAQWTFGSLNGAITRGSGNARYSVFGELHEGSGRDGINPLPYHIEVLGLAGTYFRRLSVQLEDKEVDVEKTHGNLPKAGISYLWNPHLQTQVSYADSVNGNLGTQLTSGRIDLFYPGLNSFVGVSHGRVSPSLVGLPGEAEGQVIPGQRLTEVYVGLTRTIAPLRGDLGLIADYQDLSGSKRYKVTLNYIFHVGHHGQAR